MSAELGFEEHLTVNRTCSINGRMLEGRYLRATASRCVPVVPILIHERALSCGQLGHRAEAMAEKQGRLLSQNTTRNDQTLGVCVLTYSNSVSSIPERDVAAHEMASGTGRSTDQIPPDFVVNL